jgi:hypothetical protein
LSLVQWTELEQVLQPALALQAEKKLVLPAAAVRVLQLKRLLSASYLSLLVYYFVRKADRAACASHPIVNQLVRARTALQTLAPLADPVVLAAKAALAARGALKTTKITAGKTARSASGQQSPDLAEDPLPVRGSHEDDESENGDASDVESVEGEGEGEEDESADGSAASEPESVEEAPVSQAKRAKASRASKVSCCPCAYAPLD